MSSSAFATPGLPPAVSISGHPTRCTYTPFWSPQSAPAGFLTQGSWAGSSVVSRLASFPSSAALFASFLREQSLFEEKHALGASVAPSHRRRVRQVKVGGRGPSKKTARGGHRKGESDEGGEPAASSVGAGAFSVGRRFLKREVVNALDAAYFYDLFEGEPLAAAETQRWCRCAPARGSFHEDSEDEEVLVCSPADAAEGRGRTGRKRSRDPRPRSLDGRGREGDSPEDSERESDASNSDQALRIRGPLAPVPPDSSESARPRPSRCEVYRQRLARASCEGGRVALPLLLTPFGPRLDALQLSALRCDVADAGFLSLGSGSKRARPQETRRPRRLDKRSRRGPARATLGEDGDLSEEESSGDDFCLPREADSDASCADHEGAETPQSARAHRGARRSPVAPASRCSFFRRPGFGAAAVRMQPRRLLEFRPRAFWSDASEGDDSGERGHGLPRPAKPARRVTERTLVSGGVEEGAGDGAARASCRHLQLPSPSASFWYSAPSSLRGREAARRRREAIARGLEEEQRDERAAGRRLLEVRVDDKHPLRKWVFARNSAGVALGALRLEESEELTSAAEDEDDASGQEAPRQAQRVTQRGVVQTLVYEHLVDIKYGGRKRLEGLPSAVDPRAAAAARDRPRHEATPASSLRPHSVCRSCGCPVRPSSHGREAAARAEPSARSSAASCPFVAPLRSWWAPGDFVVSASWSGADSGELAMLSADQTVKLWRAERPAEVSASFVLPSAATALRGDAPAAATALGSSQARATGRLRWSRTDASEEAIQSLAFDPHSPSSLLLAGQCLWRRDLRTKASLLRLFPAPAPTPPTYGAWPYRLTSLFSLRWKSPSLFSAFSCLAPHPRHPTLLATVHGASDSLLLFDLRAAHAPLTRLTLQASSNLLGARYRSLQWMSHTSASSSALSSLPHTAALSPSSTFDLLSAFCWRSADVVVSSFRFSANALAPFPSPAEALLSPEERRFLGVEGPAASSGVSAYSRAKGDRCCSAGVEDDARCERRLPHGRGRKRVEAGLAAGDAGLDESGAEEAEEGRQMDRSSTASSHEASRRKRRRGAQNGEGPAGQALPAVWGCRAMRDDQLEISWQVDVPLFAGGHTPADSRRRFPLTAFPSFQAHRLAAIPSYKGKPRFAFSRPASALTDEDAVASFFSGWAGVLLLKFALPRRALDFGALPSSSTASARLPAPPPRSPQEEAAAASAAPSPARGASGAAAPLLGSPRGDGAAVWALVGLTASGFLLARPLLLLPQAPPHLLRRKEVAPNAERGKEPCAEGAQPAENTRALTSACSKERQEAAGPSGSSASSAPTSSRDSLDTSASRRAAAASASYSPSSTISSTAFCAHQGCLPALPALWQPPGADGGASTRAYGVLLASLADRMRPAAAAADSGAAAPPLHAPLRGRRRRGGALALRDRAVLLFHSAALMQRAATLLDARRREGAARARGLEGCPIDAERRAESSPRGDRRSAAHAHKADAAGPAAASAAASVIRMEPASQLPDALAPTSAVARAWGGLERTWYRPVKALRFLLSRHSLHEAATSALLELGGLAPGERLDDSASASPSAPHHAGPPHAVPSLARLVGSLPLLAVQPFLSEDCGSGGNSGGCAQEGAAEAAEVAEGAEAEEGGDEGALTVHEIEGRVRMLLFVTRVALRELDALRQRGLERAEAAAARAPEAARAATGRGDEGDAASLQLACADSSPGRRHHATAGHRPEGSLQPFPYRRLFAFLRQEAGKMRRTLQLGWEASVAYLCCERARRPLPLDHGLEEAAAASPATAEGPRDSPAGGLGHHRRRRSQQGGEAEAGARAASGRQREVEEEDGEVRSVSVLFPCCGGSASRASAPSALDRYRLPASRTSGSSRLADAQAVVAVRNPLFAPVPGCACDLFDCLFARPSSSIWRAEMARRASPVAAPRCPSDAAPYEPMNAYVETLRLLQAQLSACGRARAVASSQTPGLSSGAVSRGGDEAATEAERQAAEAEATALVPLGVVDALALELFLQHDVLLLPEPAAAAASAAASDGVSLARARPPVLRPACARTSFCFLPFVLSFRALAPLLAEEKALARVLYAQPWERILAKIQRLQQERQAELLHELFAPFPDVPVDAPQLPAPLRARPPPHTVAALQGRRGLQRLLTGLGVSDATVAYLLKRWTLTTESLTAGSQGAELPDDGADARSASVTDDEREADRERASPPSCEGLLDEDLRQGRAVLATLSRLLRELEERKRAFSLVFQRSDPAALSSRDLQEERDKQRAAEILLASLRSAGARVV
ncbi:hypothetical protein BESB_021800 [Besnoitia besnoiti]|uniref:Uncharacterized protein n=1 Tax=Besnoitia besnoiti TaxID=94643 RepID=A0A2A9M2S4_BESBE|nr:hypothetical protein BESB_021800 [Besnoitia besnoiti]PFH32239.1 hypothetical protein BESB_021800 [Besnoitia besnoiti]